MSFEAGTLRDDMAVLVIRVAVPVGEGSGPPSAPFDQRFPAMSASVSIARRELAAWLIASWSPDDLVDQVLLAVSEASTNAARAARSEFRLRAWTEGDELVVEVADDGPGFAGRLPDRTTAPDPTAERGRGLFILQAVMDACDVHSGESGTVVRARKRMAPA